MKRYFSKDDDKYYTHILKLINSLGGRDLKYNWLITNIEAYPVDEVFSKLTSCDAIFLSNDELIDMLEKEDFQWIWAVFSAMPSSLNVDEDEVFQYGFPCSKNVDVSSNSEKVIQHPLADIEINCIDSSYFIIVFKQNGLENKFLDVYSKAIEV